MSAEVNLARHRVHIGWLVLTAVLALSGAKPAMAQFDPYDKGVEFFEADDLNAARVAWFPLARAGDLRAIASLNQLFYLKGATEAEITELTALTQRIAAPPENWEAQFELATLYLRGHGLPRDPDKGMEILRTAAVRGGGEGMDKLAQMFERGSIIGRDFTQARGWYERAAEAGSAAAAWALGDIYIEARGVARDNFLAYKWYYLSGLLEQKGERRNAALRAADDVGLALSRDDIAEARRQAQALRSP